MSKLPVSVIIAARNEAPHIGPCVESVRWADQVLVVDGSSDDRTAEIAQGLGAEVLRTDNDFAEAQRLKALPSARHRWLLLLDADERVTAGLRDQIAEAISSVRPKAAYQVLRRNMYRDKPVHLHHPDYQLRLFQKDLVDLPRKIHRAPDVRGESGRLDGELTHYFFTDVQLYLKKLNAYTTEEASYWASGGRGVSGVRLAYWLLLRPLWRFVQYYFLRRGFLDGYFGFFYSVSSAYYEWVIASRFVLDPRTTAGR